VRVELVWVEIICKGHPCVKKKKKGLKQHKMVYLFFQSDKYSKLF